MQQKINKLVITPLTDNDKENYFLLYKYINKYIISDIDENYIDTYKEYLLSIVKNNNEWSKHNKEQILYTISRYLNNIGDLEYQKIYEKEAIKNPVIYSVSFSHNKTIQINRMVLLGRRNSILTHSRNSCSSEERLFSAVLR